MKKDLVSIKDLTKAEIDGILNLAEELKAKKGKFGQPLFGKSIALIFQKPSNRTRVSFEVGMHSLGGQAIYLGPEDIKLGVREATKDIAKALSRYLDGIVARTFYHKDILELSKFASVPVINGLSDLLHPCQGFGDLFTIKQMKGGFDKVEIAYVGDGNNVCHSLIFGISQVGGNLRIATPKGYEPKKSVLKDAKALSAKSGASIEIFNDPKTAVKGADIIYTDVWTSMGHEKEMKKRLKDFKGFQINDKLAKLAKKDFILMHCLPAHRGQEITDSLLDGPHSVVFDQAENRLWVQEAILIKLLAK